MYVLLLAPMELVTAHTYIMYHISYKQTTNIVYCTRVLCNATSSAALATARTHIYFISLHQLNY